MASRASKKKGAKINEKVDFWWSISYWETRIGHLGARVDENIKFPKFFDEKRLSRSLRPLRLLRSLRLLTFLMPGKSLSMQSVSSFWFFEAKEAVEVIEASKDIMSIEVFEATEVFRTP